MRVLVACECYGKIRNAFAARGHDAWSCDFLPSETPGNHYQCDVRDVLDRDWDLLIGNPTCTYLCNSGVRWLHTDPTRWQKMREGAEFFKMLLDYPIKKKCLENPIMHKYAKEIIGVNQDQVIQPWQHGHGETKATCLWLQNLPLLIPTKVVDGRIGRIHLLAPSAERWKLRSETYQGVADAMAEQWG